MKKKVVIYAFTKSKVLLVSRFRTVINNYINELPSGYIRDNESVLEAATREFYDETNTYLDPRRMSYLGSYYSSLDTTDGKVTICKYNLNLREIERLEKMEKKGVMYEGMTLYPELWLINNTKLLMDVNYIAARGMLLN